MTKSVHSELTPANTPDRTQYGGSTCAVEHTAGDFFVDFAFSRFVCLPPMESSQVVFMCCRFQEKRSIFHPSNIQPIRIHPFVFIFHIEAKWLNKDNAIYDSIDNFISSPRCYYLPVPSHRTDIKATKNDIRACRSGRSRDQHPHRSCTSTRGYLVRKNSPSSS